MYLKKIASFFLLFIFSFLVKPCIASPKREIKADLQVLWVSSHST